MKIEKQDFSALAIASTLGSGFFPIAPGTVGAAVAAFVMWFVPYTDLGLLVYIVLFFLVGVYASTVAEKYWGHDAGKINWDEVVGMMITVWLLPKNIIVFIAAFFVCRILDIIKPYPANKSQELPKGWGVMVDDVIAGIYGNILLQIVFRFLIKVN